MIVGRSIALQPPSRQQPKDIQGFDRHARGPAGSPSNALLGRSKPLQHFLGDCKIVQQLSGVRAYHFQRASSCSLRF
jgi:hypothetical protein